MTAGSWLFAYDNICILKWTTVTLQSARLGEQEVIKENN